MSASRIWVRGLRESVVMKSAQVALRCPLLLSMRHLPRLDWTFLAHEALKSLEVPRIGQESAGSGQGSLSVRASPPAPLPMWTMVCITNLLAAPVAPAPVQVQALLTRVVAQGRSKRVSPQWDTRTAVVAIALAAPEEAMSSKA